MKILITAGGTSEKIDEVRKITNTATGRLGALIAEEFKTQADAEITYIRGADAVYPPCQCFEEITILSARELSDVVTGLLKRNKFDAVIHTMAVSDYTIGGFVPARDLALRVAETLRQSNHPPDDIPGIAEIVHAELLRSGRETGIPNKISSDCESPILFLEKTAKVIKLFKQLQPETILVGFKLLSGVDEPTLLQAASRLMERNLCDFVFANDLINISGDKHEGLLISSYSSALRVSTKREAAQAIAKAVIEKLRGAV